MTNVGFNIAAETGAILQALVGLAVSLWFWTLRFLAWFVATFRSFAPLVVLLLAFGIFYAVREIWREMERGRRYLTLEDIIGLTPVSQKRTLKAWEVIENRLKSKEPEQYKLAAIEADDLFSDLLLAMGHRGETFEERLVWFKPDKLQGIEDIEKAHEVADKLFNDEEAQITREGALQIILVYQKAFEELGVLEKEGEEKKEEK